MYTGEGFDFSKPKVPLEKKGFEILRWENKPPSPEELRAQLSKCGQLWVISSNQKLLSPEHIKVITDFFDAGHGVYIWGDNEPYYADANQVAQALIKTTMSGNVPGNQVWFSTSWESSK